MTKITRISAAAAEPPAVTQIREMVADYWKRGGDQVREGRARSLPIDAVIAGLLADLRNMERLYESECKAHDPLRDQIARLRDDLAESKRPFTAQMEMQNRRIIALTAEVDALRRKGEK